MINIYSRLSNFPYHDHIKYSLIIYVSVLFEKKVQSSTKLLTTSYQHLIEPYQHPVIIQFKYVKFHVSLYYWKKVHSPTKLFTTSYQHPKPYQHPINMYFLSVTQKGGRQVKFYCYSPSPSSPLFIVPTSPLWHKIDLIYLTNYNPKTRLHYYLGKKTDTLTIMISTWGLKIQCNNYKTYANNPITNTASMPLPFAHGAFLTSLMITWLVVPWSTTPTLCMYSDAVSIWSLVINLI